MSDFNWSEKFDHQLADGSVVAIDKPINHDSLLYATSMSGLRSLVRKDEYENEMPEFSAQFMIPYNTVQEIAYGHFVVTSRPEVVSVQSEGVLVACDVYPVCNIDKTISPKIDDRGYPFECWFEREEAAGRISNEDVDLDEDYGIDELEHYCAGQVSEYAVAVHGLEEGEIDNLVISGDCDPVSDSLSDSDDRIIGMLDDAFVTRVTDPEGKEWRVVGGGHND